VAVGEIYPHAARIKGQNLKKTHFYGENMRGEAFPQASPPLNAPVTLYAGGGEESLVGVSP
jgi:hypothetical protein